MATQNNKRKASDLGNDIGTGQNVMSLEVFMKRSDERSEQFESLLKQLVESNKKLVESNKKLVESNKKLVESNKNLTKKVEALGTFAIPDDQQEKITGYSGTKEEEDDEEDSSDDEESVVDESDAWTGMLKQLREYRIMNGNCNFSRKDNPKLGTWINNQRTHYKGFQTGKGRKIKPERIIKLERLGFSWNTQQAPPVLWDGNFEQLQHFQQRMGNCNIPFNATNPTQLAKWAAFQRTEYKRWKKGRD